MKIQVNSTRVRVTLCCLKARDFAPPRPTNPVKNMIFKPKNQANCFPIELASFLQAMVNSHLSEMEQVLKEMKRRTDGLESPLEMGENPYTMTLDPTLTCDQESATPSTGFG